MSEEIKSIKQGCIDAIEHINQFEQASMNYEMHPEFVSAVDEEKKITIRFKVQPFEINGIGTLHGGILCSMLDFTSSLALKGLALCPVPPTLSLTTNFIRPVQRDDAVLVTCRVTSLGRTIGTVLGEAVSEQTGKTVATSSGTFSIPKKPD